MNTKIKLTYKDVPYVLEYNRMAIKEMENAGFILSDFQSKPMTTVDLAFKGLFLKNHRRTPEKLIDEIYSQLKNKQALIETIGQMLSECYDSLVDNDEESGNIAWDIAN